ncbi:hypothetical protein [Flagellimonas sp.]|uniref:hypothetical protein n=1 Tax=Flagellimonas sp. TaxID=2058762 RepID=UPI003AB399E6
MVSKSILIGTLLMFLGCAKSSFDQPQKLWDYLKDPRNDYHFVKKVRAVEYTLTYRPTDLMVSQELNEGASMGAVDSIRRKYGPYMYFDLGISIDGQEVLNRKVYDKQIFGELVGQLSFGMADKIHLITKNRDTIELMDFAYPRLYGLSKNTKILLVFQREDKILVHDYFLLAIKDLGFETGEVTFKVDTDKIIKEPKLIFND